jgi:hypothetical protein
MDEEQLCNDCLYEKLDANGYPCRTCIGENNEWKPKVAQITEEK